MKKVKVIDLINMIFEGKAPKRFIWGNTLYYIGKENKEMYFSSDGLLGGIRFKELSEEIEIVEE